MNTNPTKKNFEDFIQEVDQLLTDPVTPIMGYAISIVQNGRISFEHANGYRRFSETNPTRNLPMIVGTRYRIASISKMFVCLSIMQQVEAGRMSLDHDASEYLGFPLRNPNYPDRVITPRLLMAHYSSIRDGSAYSVPVDVPISECFLPDGRYYKGGEHYAAPEDGKDRGPGKYYVYSNLNYGLLGTIVERLSGERFDQYARNHVLKPMGIYASYNPSDFNEEEIHNLATIYKRIADGVWAADKPWTPQEDDYQDQVQDPTKVLISNPDLGTADVEEDITNYAIGTNATIFSPQGGLRISAHELALFNEMMLAKGVASNGTRIISEESVKELLTPVWVYNPSLDNIDVSDCTRCYCAGINMISTEFGGDHMVRDREDITMFGHTGSAYGLISACYFDPVNNIAFSYAINGLGADESVYHGEYSNRTIWHERIMSALFRHVFPL